MANEQVPVAAPPVSAPPYQRLKPRHPRRDLVAYDIGGYTAYLYVREYDPDMTEEERLAEWWRDNPLPLGGTLGTVSDLVRRCARWRCACGALAGSVCDNCGAVNR